MSRDLVPPDLDVPEVGAEYVALRFAAPEPTGCRNDLIFRVPAERAFLLDWIDVLAGTLASALKVGLFVKLPTREHDESREWSDTVPAQRLIYTGSTPCAVCGVPIGWAGVESGNRSGLVALSDGGVALPASDCLARMFDNAIGVAPFGRLWPEGTELHSHIYDNGLGDEPAASVIVEGWLL